MLYFIWEEFSEWVGQSVLERLRFSNQFVYKSGREHPLSKTSKQLHKV